MRALRALTVGVVGAVLSLGLTACSSGTSGTSAEVSGGPGGAGATSAPAASGAGAFPRTVKHAMGETAIPTRPLRVVAYDDPAVGPIKEKFEANPLWDKLKGVKHDVADVTWMTAVGIQGAHSILDDLARMFEVDPAKAA